MKIVQILGGLGNQMFQYALLVALRETFRENVLMDLGAFKGYHLHNGFELDRIFNITACAALNSDVQRIYHRFLRGYQTYRIYKHCFPKNKNEFQELEATAYNPVLFEKKGDCYYDGYWQDYRYFYNYTEQIKKEFSYKTPLSHKNLFYTNMLASKLSVSLHIRRGDYNTDKVFGGVCEESYYNKAIDYIKTNFPSVACFIIFSNDIQWCREKILPLISPKTEVIIADWNKGPESYNDMRLMSQCKINVIANSSFSWWGAFLNEQKDAVVIAPKKWTHTGQTAIRQMPTWILL